MILSSKTDIGPVRDSNQDSFDCGTFENGATWAVVCDGMGGVSGGQIASEICVEKVSAAIKRGYRKNINVKGLKNLLESAISVANSAVFEESSKKAELKGMGTTVVAVVVYKGVAVIAHVGDSRAYCINENITPLTKDHSLVQLMIDTGKITKEEAKTHPDRNIITRAVGIQNFVDAEIDIADVSDDDKILICTDGLCGVVEDEDILDIIKQYGDSSAEKLVEASIKCGSRDNITAVVIDGNQGE